MTKEREIREEPGTFPWDSSRRVIYENGQRVGELREEEQEAVLFFRGDKVTVEIDNDGARRSPTRRTRSKADSTGCLPS